MLKIVKLLVVLLVSQFSWCQLVINELDCDTPSVDNQEFLELKSVTVMKENYYQHNADCTH